LDSPDDLQALARYWYRCRQYDPALRALDEATTRVMDQTQRAAVHRLRGHILKRIRDYDSAHEEWRRAEQSSPGDGSIAEELAKHLEHRRRDFKAALDVVDGALAALSFRRAVGNTAADDLYERLLYRRSRLLRKLTNV
jgi:tetratricopeptide (TPR) repeat protein